VRLPVLLYHHIGPSREGLYPTLTISPSTFQAQLRWLADRGYVGIRPADWLRWRRDGKALPTRPVLLTFDDGYADLAEHAFPVLREFRFGAAVFIVTARIGGKNTWDAGRGGLGTAPLMTKDQIRTWAARGIEFGSHSRTHADLTTLTHSQLQEEVSGSQEDLAEVLGTRPTAFAYPYGSHSEAVRQTARKAFDLAFTVTEGMNDSGTDLYRLKRTMMWPADTTRDLAWRLRLGWSPLRRLRSSLPVRSLARLARRD
jgi:peptidoglycan/xylan/chitin deacetylase (PgdA/CDA1 family)